MKTTIHQGSALPAEVISAWDALRQKNADLASPFFTSAFTQIVASTRDDIEVASIEDAGRIVAVFPYQRRRFNIAGPVGEFLSDYEGLISAPDCTMAPRQLLRDCGLAAWDFEHLRTGHAGFATLRGEQNKSPIIDLSEGFEKYVLQRRQAGTEQIKKSGNLLRRLEREVGAVRFEAHSPEKALLRQCMEWKSALYRRNQWRDVFSLAWVRNVVDQIHSFQKPDFAGRLSVLRAGDNVVAVHFGMRSENVWHYWFPAYDPAFAKYSPGLILLLKMAESAPGTGVRTIDLGCGEHSYKERLMNGSIATAKGCVESPCLTTIARRLWLPLAQAPSRVRCWIGRSPLGPAARNLRRRFAGRSETLPAPAE